MRPKEIIAKEDWNESHRHFRPGIDWREEMSEERARIYAEDFDERQLRQRIMERGSKEFGFWDATVPGFLAGVLGSRQL